MRENKAKIRSKKSWIRGWMEEYV